MLRVLDRGLRLCDGITRRDWLRIGGIGLGGLSLPALLQARESARPTISARAKSVIIFGLVGGPPQHDTWDPKPDAPAEIRGEFARIATRTPGLFVSELMPHTARLTNKIAVLRAVSTGDNAHSSSGYQMLTGIPHLPLSRESAPVGPPNNWPSIGAMVRALCQRPGELPAAITIPEHIWNDGNFPWPGQDAGFLGQRHHPWLIHCEPDSERFTINGMTLPDDVPPDRLARRRSLLAGLQSSIDRLDRGDVIESFDSQSQNAFDLIRGARAQGAFALDREPAQVRDRYGRSRFAQSVLLARRLVEAGVSLVQVNWTRIPGRENQGGWDTHSKNNESLKTHLMPMMDAAFSALLEDLEARGLLDETLVVWFGEFGRTPRFNARAGRDHWGHVFSIALAGGGIRGGVVHGVSDRNGAYPVDGIVRPSDLIATIFHCLGFEPGHELRDSLNRPIPISRGQVIDAVLAAH